MDPECTDKEKSREDTWISQRKENRIDFLGGLGGGSEWEQEGPYGRGGAVGESTERGNCNRGH